jgi:hypothetical protein
MVRARSSAAKSAAVQPGHRRERGGEGVPAACMVEDMLVIVYELDHSIT